MCGLVMLITKHRNGLTHVQKNVVSTLLYLSGGFRGRDGAGVVAVDHIGNVKMAKAGCSVDPFMMSKEYNDTLDKAVRMGWGVFAHNRAATRGVVSDANSHPFIVDDKIVLIHNGTFFSDHKKVAETEVDSEAIAKTLADDTLTTEEALRKINAAYALIWYNVEKKQINVIRNSSRPLWFMETDDAYIYASERPFLQFVRAKFHLTAKESPFEIKEGALTTFTLGEDKSTTLECTPLDVEFWKHNASSARPFRDEMEDMAWAGHMPNANAWENDDAKLFGPIPNQHMRGYGARERIFNTKTREFVDVDLPEDPDETPISEPAIIGDQPTTIRKRDSITTRTVVALDKVAETIGNALKGTTHEDFIKLNELYANKKKVKVLVSELVEATSEPRTNDWILIGRTIDEHRMYCVFPMREKSLKEITETHIEALFEVDYSGLTWNRTPLIPNPRQGLTLPEMRGFALMHGVNAMPIYVSQPNIVAC